VEDVADAQPVGRRLRLPAQQLAAALRVLVVHIIAVGSGSGWEGGDRGRDGCVWVSVWIGGVEQARVGLGQEGEGVELRECY
jgi:hypothetical protein